MEDFDVELDESETQHHGSSSINSEVCYIPNVMQGHKPFIGQEFDSLDMTYAFYNNYARQAGFSVRIGSSNRNRENEISRKVYTCSKEGEKIVRAPKPDSKQPKRRRGITRESCNAKLAVLKSGDKFKVSIFEEVHNHTFSSPGKVQLLPSHRHVSSAQRALAQTFNNANIPPSQLMSVLELQAGGLQNIGCTEQDIRNARRDARKATDGHDADMLNEHFLTQKERNPNFTYAIETDDENRISHIFWADASSREAYKHFGDVVVFDTTYQTNKYDMIFAPILGVNHHEQTITFGCGFLCDENPESFIWLFEEWMKVMPGEPPKMIITDQDSAMEIAIEHVFPTTCHRYCIWHILNKFSEKVGACICNQYYESFRDCIWDSEDPEEFECRWAAFIERSELHENGWLQTMFNKRDRWVPAFVKHVFSAKMSSSQRAESNHSFAKKSVDRRNSLWDFITRFNRALSKQRYGELQADHVDHNERPMLKTPVALEGQMANIYTRSIFKKFQDELWESMKYGSTVKVDNEFHTIYEVERRVFDGGKGKGKGKGKSTQRQNEDGEKTISDRVRLIVDDKVTDFASCSCKNFEWEGIPCRHLLHYFFCRKQYNELPGKYILKRWTKGAKCMSLMENSAVNMEDAGDRGMLVRRIDLYGVFARVVDGAVLSVEGTDMLREDLLASEMRIKSLSIGEGSNNLGVPSNCPPINSTPVLLEPNQVRAKGCGRRIKGGKEKAREQNLRKCNECGQWGQSHDKRNCPALMNIPAPSTNVRISRNREGISNDEVFSSTGFTDS